MKHDRSHPSQTDAPNSWKRPMVCPRCGSPARVVANPFYGVGLAVHRHLYGCTQCEFVEFWTTPQDDADVTGSQPDRTPQWQRLGGRLARLLRVAR